MIILFLLRIYKIVTYYTSINIYTTIIDIIINYKYLFNLNLFKY